MKDSSLPPLRTCDIVMKGGITSGVVYPKAIVTLAKRFRFVNLGGTSAGAIAAAAAAAAEYRRTVKGCDKGFAKISGLGELLAQTPEGSTQTRLFSLFRPNAATRRVFEVITGALGGGGSAAFTMLRHATEQFAGATLLGALPGFLLSVFSFCRLDAGAIAWVWAFVGILLGLLGAAGAAVASFAFEFIREVPANNFALCSGMPDEGTGKLPAEPLTLWLTEYLNEVAGFAPDHRPLIFGDLWGCTEAAQDPSLRKVNLEMMTTNLTHGRPYRLPFRNDDDIKENHLFYFREDEFRRLFPESVVNWMKDHPRPFTGKGKELEEQQIERDRRAKAGYFPMPAPENLPVVVVTRMSLSFPVLLSAIPLHSIDRTKEETYQQLERCWFTDGGLCSNLPLHFFDSPLPRRPTFSIDLTEKPDDTEKKDLKPSMETDNQPLPTDRWNRFDVVTSNDQSKEPSDKTPFGKLAGFASTLISTMQNWNDAMQSRLPGYRDRIVAIPLTSKQGGLNLNMPDELIAFLAGQGDQAADILMKHFDPAHPDPEKTMTWENHRWIRLRSMLASFEIMVKQTLSACEGPENGDQSYEDYLKSLLKDPSKPPKGPSYKTNDKRIQAALDTLAQLRALRDLWDKAGGADDKAPRPRPILRPRPQI